VRGVDQQRPSKAIAKPQQQKNEVKKTNNNYTSWNL